nr:hypothetical protein Iba_chr13fCG2440 [Ipomoea batatas]
MQLCIVPSSESDLRTAVYNLSFIYQRSSTAATALDTKSIVLSSSIFLSSTTIDVVSTEELLSFSSVCNSSLMKASPPAGEEPSSKHKHENKRKSKKRVWNTEISDSQAHLCHKGLITALQALTEFETPMFPEPEMRQNNVPNSLVPWETAFQIYLGKL